jgi:hypothetical protein
MPVLARCPRGRQEPVVVLALLSRHLLGGGVVRKGGAIRIHGDGLDRVLTHTLDDRPRSLLVLLAHPVYRTHTPSLNPPSSMLSPVHLT